MGNIKLALGKMIHQIQLANVTSNQDTSGTWKPNADEVIYTGLASAVRNSGANNAEFGSQDVTLDQYEFQIRYQQGLVITVNTRCIYKNRVYKISNVRLLNEDRYGRIVFDGTSSDFASNFDTV